MDTGEREIHTQGDINADAERESWKEIERKHTRTDAE
jgi:hypothetical protein